MTDSAAEIAARVIPETTTLTAAEADVVLEIAYLAIAADHKLADAEIDAFRGVMSKLAGAPVTERALNEKLDALNAKVERVDVDEHLRALGKDLSPGARAIAYKVAHAIALADLDSSDAEFEFDLQLIDALELSGEQADALALEVESAMQRD